MLRKKDLAKEFAIVVKQEIKNHNDAMLATNVNLEKFKNRIEELTQNLKKESAIRVNQFSDNSIKVDRCLKDHKKKIDEKVDIYDKEIFRIKTAFDKSLDRLIKLENNSSILVEIDILNNRIIDLKELADRYRDEINEIITFGLKQVEQKCKKYCDDALLEIKKEPDYFEQFKKQMLYLIEIHKCDNEKLEKEVINFRKTVYVWEKKIEYLITQNCRLKKIIDEKD